MNLSQKTIPIRHRLFHGRKVWPWIIGILLCLVVTGTIGGNLSLIHELLAPDTATPSTTATESPVASTSPQVTATRTPVPTLNNATVTIVPQTPTATMAASSTNTVEPTATQIMTSPLSAEETSRLLAFTSANCPRKPSMLKIRVRFLDANTAEVVANYCAIEVRNATGIAQYELSTISGEDDHGWIMGTVWKFKIQVIKKELAIVAQRSAFTSFNGEPMIEYGEIIGVDKYVHIQVLPRLIPTETPIP